jgi:hypothetical protein
MADPSARDVARDPDWLPHTYDVAGENLTLVHVPRDARQELTFLTAKHFAERFTKGSFPVGSIASELSGVEQAPMHFIFHTAFCGSTLLAKALTIPSVAEALREPDVLVNLANRLTRSDDAANRQRLELVLKLLDAAELRRDRAYRKGAFGKPFREMLRREERQLLSRVARDVDEGQVLAGHIVRMRQPVRVAGDVACAGVSHCASVRLGRRFCNSLMPFAVPSGTIVDCRWPP